MSRLRIQNIVMLLIKLIGEAGKTPYALVPNTALGLGMNSHQG